MALDTIPGARASQVTRRRLSGDNPVWMSLLGFGYGVFKVIGLGALGFVMVWVLGMEFPD